MNIKFTTRCVFILSIFLGIFSLSDLAYAQTWTQTLNQIKENTQQIETIDKKIFDLEDNYRLLYDGAKNQNDQLGNQISFASYLVGVFAAFFTILGIFLAWYINRQYEKVKGMKDIVETTKNAIDGHSTDLYKKLKREETLSLLTRLEEVPEDITNICSLLLSRDLIETDYLYLKGPYIKVKSSLTLDINAKNNYITLLMQHFPYESLKDRDLKDEIIVSINLLSLHGMFSRDVRNFFDQTLKYVKEFGVADEENKAIIKKLFYNYSKSKFQPDAELQDYIKKTLSKNGMKTISVASILKEQAPTDTAYTAWIDLIFT